MINKEILAKKIEKLPLDLLKEVANYIDYIEFREAKDNQLGIQNITLASEKSLSKDWLKPEEDEAWEHL
ncbi:DUF2281 domain-containing protein [Clostridium sp. Cult2]|uniref:DUF2281 domain-containing protein n=1 Tax=Clostridium sp. Cult2 TaxID=2079003 RepID=UPI001F24EF83|nr:DUF2281 domain-containing protein [Clostridium sp. Cult2]MCF6465437.1 DUF2281 domain-containing protein [Clostridium sp. Cult2]